MSNLVGNPHCWFSHAKARFIFQKVRYRMFDNYTHFDSIIRTCSSGDCQSITMDHFTTCVKEPKKYMISGCVLKSCCQDRDLCNSGLNWTFYYSWFTILFQQILVYLLLCLHS